MDLGYHSCGKSKCGLKASQGSCGVFKHGRKILGLLPVLAIGNSWRMRIAVLCFANIVGSFSLQGHVNTAS